MSKKAPMKLVDKRSNMMQCQVCGNVHLAPIKGNSNGKFVRGSWQCVHGCLMPTKAESLAYDGRAFAWVEMTTA